MRSPPPLSHPPHLCRHKAYLHPTLHHTTTNPPYCTIHIVKPTSISQHYIFGLPWWPCRRKLEASAEVRHRSNGTKCIRYSPSSAGRERSSFDVVRVGISRRKDSHQEVSSLGFLRVASHAVGVCGSFGVYLGCWFE